MAGLLVDNLNFPTVEIVEDGNSIRLDKIQVKLLVRLAAILHDIGHGPFSHAFERSIKDKMQIKNVQIHEDYTIKIIESPDRSIHQILNNIQDETLRKYSSKWIRDILSGIFKPNWIKEIISSQFDADRIDYLLRDAYMCGVKYATFDWKWIFYNAFIGEIKPQNRQGIIFDANKGIHSLESFIISRYHMYEQVYFHKTTRGFESIANSIFKRINFLIDNNKIDDSYFLGKSFLNFLNDYNSIEDYMGLDDNYMISHFNHWMKHSKDEILRRLCFSFINRQPFKLVHTITDKNYDYAEERKREKTYESKMGVENFEYFFLIDDYKNNPYKDNYLMGKKKAEESELIWLKIGSQVEELSNRSIIINALRNKEYHITRLFVHKDFL